MNEQQQQSAFAFCSHWAILQYGLYHRATWKDVRESVLLMLVAMQHAWGIEPNEANQKIVEAVVEQIREHVYETDYRNILAYCYEHQRQAEGSSSPAPQEEG